MKKLTLDLAALRVESFRASPDTGAPRGTVRANDSHATTFTQTLVQTTTDPNLQCMCQSGSPCVNTLETACGPDCL